MTYSWMWHFSIVSQRLLQLWDTWVWQWDTTSTMRHRRPGHGISADRGRQWSSHIDHSELFQTVRQCLQVALLRHRRPSTHSATAVAVGRRPTAYWDVRDAGNGRRVAVGARTQQDVAYRRLACRWRLNTLGVQRTVIVTTQRRLLSSTSSLVGHLGVSDIRR